MAHKNCKYCGKILKPMTTDDICSYCKQDLEPEEDLPEAFEEAREEDEN